MTTSPDDADDISSWIKEQLQQFEVSPEAASMSCLERAYARADVIMHCILRLDEPMRTDVALRILARCEEYLEAQR